MSEELERASETEAGAKVTDSSGNVFADLDLAHGEEDMLKIHIALAITNTLRKGGLTQAAAFHKRYRTQAEVRLT